MTLHRPIPKTDFIFGLFSTNAVALLFLIVFEKRKRVNYLTRHVPGADQKPLELLPDFFHERKQGSDSDGPKPSRGPAATTIKGGLLGV